MRQLIIFLALFFLTCAGCDKLETEPVPTSHILKSNNSSPERASVSAWKDGNPTKATVKDKTYKITNKDIESITYDSITAEKNGYEKFFKGKTTVKGEQILDINLIFNGEYKAKLYGVNSTPKTKVTAYEKGEEIGNTIIGEDKKYELYLITDGILDSAVYSLDNHKSITHKNIPLEYEKRLEVELEEIIKTFLVQGTMYDAILDKTIGEGNIQITTLNNNKKHVAQIQQDGNFSLEIKGKEYTKETEALVQVEINDYYTKEAFTIIKNNTLTRTGYITANINTPEFKKREAKTTLRKLTFYGGSQISVIADTILNKDVIESIANQYREGNFLEDGSIADTPASDAYTASTIKPFIIAYSQNDEDTLTTQQRNILYEGVEFLREQLETPNKTKHINMEETIESFAGWNASKSYLVISHNDSQGITEQFGPSFIRKDEIDGMFITTTANDNANQIKKLLAQAYGIRENKEGSIEFGLLYNKEGIITDLSPQGKFIIGETFIKPPGFYEPK